MQETPESEWADAIKPGVLGADEALINGLGATEAAKYLGISNPYRNGRLTDAASTAFEEYSRAWAKRVSAAMHSERAPTRHHATKKSPAQLDREIAEALARPHGKPANGDAAGTDAAEFQRRRNLPYVEVRHMSAGRTADIHLSLGGVDLGSRHDTLKRGKVVSTHYVLTPISRLVDQLHDDERVALDAMLAGNGKRSTEINTLIPDPAQRTYVKMLADQLKNLPPR